MIYKLNAFTKDKNGGNPAAVVLNADSLSEAEMQRSAAEFDCPETAFVMRSKKADFRLRFFTPTQEIDLCGHATIAAFTLLRDLEIIKTGQYTQETKAGVLQIKVAENEIFMEQNAPVFLDILTKDEIKHCFGKTDYLADLPIQIVSTGLKDIILPVKSLKELLALKPNHREILKLSEKHDAVGIHAFSLQSFSNAAAHTRNFAPRYGILEEAATGTANGALAAYLSENLKSHQHLNSFTMEQGYGLARPSLIKVRLKKSRGEIQKVYVGGSAVPSAGDD